MRWRRRSARKLGLDAGHGGARRGRDGRREHGQRRPRACRSKAARPMPAAPSSPSAAAGRCMAAAWRRRSGSTRVLVPIGAGVGSAIGFLRAPVGYEVVRSLYQRLGRFRRGGGERAARRTWRRRRGVVAEGGFGAPTRQTASPICAMSARGMRSRSPLPPRRMTAEATCRRSARLRPGIRPLLRPARCRAAMSRS